jgi:lipoprotein-releasing system ATP-binding protein
MLSIKNISKSYSQRGIVLNNLCLDVQEGDSIAVMGPSGSGKTTLMNIIGLLDKPDTGEITFRGNPISGFTEDQSAIYRSLNVGFVFQDHLLLPYLTVLENIQLPLMAVDYTKEELESRREMIQNLMKKTGIEELANKYSFEISGGEAQRVALVRALANNPSFLIADEPTGSLDANNARNLGELLLELNRELGKTLIVATHSHELATKMSRLMTIMDGKLINSN